MATLPGLTSVLATVVLASLWRHAACVGNDPKASNDLNTTAPHVQPGYSIVDNKVNSSECKVLPVDPNLSNRVQNMHSDNVKLVTYTITIQDYDVNPLLVNVTHYYRANMWRRTFSSHGRTLLTLAFNYDVVSLLMLTFGVEGLDVALKDEPRGCLGDLEEDDKMAVLLDLLVADFQTEGDKVMVGDEPHVCDEVIDRDYGGKGEFSFRCCRRRPSDDRLECTENNPSGWISFVYVLIVTVKIAALLYGPVMLISAFHSGSMRNTNYVLQVKEPICQTLFVNKQELSEPSDGVPRKQERKFKNFRRLLNKVPPNEAFRAKFKKLQLSVDHRKLISEKKVPVGLFRFLYEQIFRCGMRDAHPFKTCCTHSVCGSWARKFLWFGLNDECECDDKTKRYISWENLAMGLGGVATLFAIPFPYYVRVLIYLNFEHEELILRREALATVGLNMQNTHHILHSFPPQHGFLLFVYLTYLSSFTLLVAFKAWNKDRFDEIVFGALQDLRHVSGMECGRLILAHFVLPFEKFGIVGGVLVGFLYWPIVIPICVVVALIYCIPLFYLTGRFMIHARPPFLYLNPRTPVPYKCGRYTPGWDDVHHLSDGTSSFESALLLENISPRNVIDAVKTRAAYTKINVDRDSFIKACVSFAIGICSIALMYSTLVLFADVFGFVIEVFVFTLMGAIVNAGSAARYLMLIFWILMYSTSCYNVVYDNYMALNKKIFQCVKDKLGSDIRAVTLLREEKQKNTAFKYFTPTELKDFAEDEEEIDTDSDEESDEETPRMKREEKLHICKEILDVEDDKIQWRINCLVFFVDNKDVPRIPEELFRRICNIRAPGCPGPVYQSLLRATKQLMYMVVFMLFVMIIVMSFGNIYRISTTNQMLMTLAGGFVPFVVRFALKPAAHKVEMGTYSFEGKVHLIIRTFTQLWPAFDLTFVPGDSEETAQDPTKHGGGEKTDGHVDGHIEANNSLMQSLMPTVTADPSDRPIDLYVSMGDGQNPPVLPGEDDSTDNLGPAFSGPKRQRPISVNVDMVRGSVMFIDNDDDEEEDDHYHHEHEHDSESHV